MEYSLSKIMNKKEVIDMQYLFTCPTQGCNFSVKVDTQNGDWAVEKIIEVSSVHDKQTHPNLPSMTVQQIKNVVLSGVKNQ
jgi:type 1 glutamine amidotransferase